ncbi:hypothetical protein AB0869_14945 [Micromonospora vinacea]|uniref:hypothetical protein n=1 Tax=Micromonospora vinacea TaxID=709878 RepID=UPI003456A278
MSKALSPTSNALAALLPAQLVAGFGLGLTFVATTVVAINGVAPQDTGIASGVVNTNQQIGGALGLALLSGVAAAVAADQPSGTAGPGCQSTPGAATRTAPKVTAPSRRAPRVTVTPSRQVNCPLSR